MEGSGLFCALCGSVAPLAIISSAFRAAAAIKGLISEASGRFRQYFFGISGFTFGGAEPAGDAHALLHGVIGVADDAGGEKNPLMYCGTRRIWRQPPEFPLCVADRSDDLLDRTAQN
jgi:hypothetical protein